MQLSSYVHLSFPPEFRYYEYANCSKLLEPEGMGLVILFLHIAKHLTKAPQKTGQGHEWYGTIVKIDCAIQELILSSSKEFLYWKSKILL